MMRRVKEDFLEQIFPHQAHIHKICRMYRDSKEDREDLFQEIIYQLWKAYPQFQERSKLTTWMYRIGLNTAIATFRKCKIPQSPLEDHHSDAVSVSESTTVNEAYDQMLYAIWQLKKDELELLTVY